MPLITFAPSATLLALQARLEQVQSQIAAEETRIAVESSPYDRVTRVEMDETKAFLFDLNLAHRFSLTF